MAETLKAEEMTPADFKAALRHKPAAIIATGILEWHGDHLPLGTDALKMRGIAERLAERAEVVLLPQNWFGVVGFDEMVGTITFSRELVKQILAEYFENVEKMGAKVIVLLTGHYGPYQVETIAEAAREYMAGSAVRIIAQPEYEGVDFSGFPCGPDHADIYETSLMMAVRPDLVQMDRFQPRIEIPGEYEHRETSNTPRPSLAAAFWTPSSSTSPPASRKSSRAPADPGELCASSAAGSAVPAPKERRRVDETRRGSTGVGPGRGESGTPRAFLPTVLGGMEMTKRVSPLFAIIVVVIVVALAVLWNLTRLKATDSVPMMAPSPVEQEQMRQRLMRGRGGRSGAPPQPPRPTAPGSGAEEAGEEAAPEQPVEEPEGGPEQE
jgi:creatinine amidohydrolase